MIHQSLQCESVLIYWWTEKFKINKKIRSISVLLGRLIFIACLCVFFIYIFFLMYCVWERKGFFLWKLKTEETYNRKKIINLIVVDYNFDSKSYLKPNKKNIVKSLIYSSSSFFIFTRLYCAGFKNRVLFFF